MIQKIINYLNKLIFNLEQNRLKYDIEIYDINRSENLISIQKLWKSYQNRGVSKYDELMNVCIFALINGRDIQFLSKNYLTTKNGNERNLFGRLLCMTIIEFLEDINSLLGKKLRVELINNNYQEFIDELKLISKDFASIKKSHNKILRKIRNNAAAHKTKNSKDLIDFTHNLEIDDLLAISIEIMKINNRFTILSTKIIEKNSVETQKQIEKMS